MELEKMNWITRFTHNVFHWHKPIDNIGCNGTSLTSKCKYCGKEILQDSQGNWF